MEPLWQLWKQGFSTWEQATAKLFETLLKSPTLLEPTGQALSAFMRTKKQADDASAQAWAALGLPTRRDQERMLHLLNQLGSRIMDLEDKIDDLEQKLARQTAPSPAPSPAPAPTPTPTPTPAPAPTPTPTPAPMPSPAPAPAPANPPAPPNPTTDSAPSARSED